MKDTEHEPNGSDSNQFSSEVLTSDDLDFLRKSASRAKNRGMSRKEFLKLCGTEESQEYVKFVWKTL